MHGSALFFTVLALLIFFFSGALLRLLSDKIHVPFPLLLVILGLLFSLGSGFAIDHFHLLETLHHPEKDDFLYSLLNKVGNFSFSPELVFYIFLPTLLFESAFNLRISELRQSLMAISGLAIFSLVLSVGLIGTALHFLLGLPWVPSILFGIIVSATDPVSVLGTFREVGAPRRLRTIVEGESLFNDGTALVLLIIIGGSLLISGDVEHSFTFLGGIFTFLKDVLGSIALGIGFGFFFSKIIEFVRDNHNVEMTFALILAHSTFLFAEYFGISGIIATAASGIVLGNYGRHKISPNVQKTMHHFWDHMAFIVNSLVFLLIGIAIAKSFSPAYWVPSLAAIGVVIIARFLSVIPVLSFLNLFSTREHRIPFSWQVIIAHGGLRGALAVVMLLLINPEYEYLSLLQAMTVSVITFLFLVNGTTIEWILKKFKLMDFTPSDTLEIEESHVLVSHSMKEHLDKMKKKRYVAPDVYENIADSYRRAETKAILKIRKMIEGTNAFSAEDLLLILKRHCLGVENQIFHQLFAAEEISEDTLIELSGSTERQRERLFYGKIQEKQKSEESFYKRIKSKEKSLHRLFSFFNTSKFFNRWIRNWKKKQVLLKHDRYRARRISAWNVLKYLDQLEKNGLFVEEGVLEKVRKSYKRWFRNAEEKQVELEQQFPCFLKDRKFYLTKRNCYTLERKMIHDLMDRGIVTQKVFLALEKSLEIRLNRIRKDAVNEYKST